jgi:hypothetical protein
MDGFELRRGKGKVERKQDISRNILGISFTELPPWLALTGRGEKKDE